MASLLTCSQTASAPAQGGGAVEVDLPKPHPTSMSLDAAIMKRRSIRALAPDALSAGELAQLLWAAQGITDAQRGLRAAPSAGALYPLEIYLARGDGVFQYLPGRHALARVRTTDARPQIASAAFDQAVVRDAPALVVITGVIARTRPKYGARAERYVAIEAGHAAQNLLLEATALDLGATPVGAFDDDAVRAAIGAPNGFVPLYVIPVGRRKP
jgi:SagB-type dehydrogenase family enzyme